MKIFLFALFVLFTAYTANALDATKPTDQSMIGTWPALLRETRAAVNAGPLPQLLTDPANPGNGQSWINISENAIKWRYNGITYSTQSTSVATITLYTDSGGNLYSNGSNVYGNQ